MFYKKAKRQIFSRIWWNTRICSTRVCEVYRRSLNAYL